MKPAIRVLLVAFLLVAAGLGRYALRERARQSAQRQTLEEKIAEARAALERTLRERETAEGGLATLVRAAKEPEAVEAASLPPDPTVTAWDKKVATLRSLLARHPEWTIPEIELLSPDEFIFFARDAQLDGEEAQRKALCDLRALAKRKLAPQFHRALEEYAKVHEGQLPADLNDLTSLFKTPVPEAVLKRYSLASVAAVPSGEPFDPILYERAPVDELYDTREILGVRVSTQIETNPAIYVLARALDSYANANPGRKPTQSVDLDPYLEVPIDAPTLDRYFQKWQKQPATLGIDRGIGATVYPAIAAPH